ncbi:MAG: MAPEG family protein [Gammaproteobacteria bacterium]|jgi:glutathione S-transferase
MLQFLISIPLSLTSLILNILLILIFSLWVGRCRKKYHSPPPEIGDNIKLQIANRIHYNSLELFILYFPIFAIFVAFYGDFYGAIVGFLFLIARIIFALGYWKNPSYRSFGSIPSFITIIILIVFDLIAII